MALLGDRMRRGLVVLGTMREDQGAESVVCWVCRALLTVARPVAGMPVTVWGGPVAGVRVRAMGRETKST